MYRPTEWSRWIVDKIYVTLFAQVSIDPPHTNGLNRPHLGLLRGIFRGLHKCMSACVFVVVGEEPVLLDQRTDHAHSDTESAYASSSGT